MSYATEEARVGLLDTIAEAVDALAKALAELTTAYELLDERTADRLEEELFGPVQTAFGRAKRAHAGFATRHDLHGRPFAPAPEPAAPSAGVKGLVERAVDHALGAEHVLSDLQDSMAPVEVGDAELRAGLADVREHLGSLRARADGFVRVLGR
ncbi:hypothetical protein [Conexibacter sp. SYSU D00693]|uniref:hypothetical protein n=1 Tax=Conexibacter sp. SYSU D00693 TaxID=2812560 RepID=UPI00196ABEA4|nr:hypothetical protein [Conexibacter sp. SYSU D00693]